MAQKTIRRRSSTYTAAQSTLHDEPIRRELLERNLPILARSMTFAKMVQANKAFSHVFKDLSWLFPPLCHRKDQAALTETERTRYLCAYTMIEGDGTMSTPV